MLYRVHDAGDGKFEIQRFEPVTIGVMYDEAMADLHYRPNEVARALLATREIHGVEIIWHEDVRH